MLDPFTALSLAAAVVQFVDFGIKLVSDGVELYETGTLSSNNELEQATRDLTQLAEELACKPQVAQYQPGITAKLSSKDEVALQQLASSCIELGDQLLSVLKGLEVQKPHYGFGSLRKALRTAMNKGRIQDIESRLKKMKDQLSVRLLAILSNKQLSVISMLENLSEYNQQHEMNIANKIDELRVELISVVQKEQRTVAGRKQLFSDIGTMCEDLAEEGIRVAASQRILNSLYFKYIKLRQATIKEAHAKTFEWIFADSDNRTKPQARFLEWMESGKGIYWISGKAGSGKSTLVKYLCCHKRTRSALKNWAGDKEPIIASYFFWSAGNTMQKSQQGLLQSLLYQILRQCPHLIPIVCPSRWKETTAISGHEPWTHQELCQAFDNIAKQGQLSTKFCFFIDGLDEYDGEHVDVVHILQSFANSSSLKLCVSSRPWNVFVEAFGGNVKQKLVLQEFTKQDIRLYAKNKLEEDHRFLKLMRLDKRYQDLIEAIVEKAQGVFLWVFLVVRSLLRGLTDDNDIVILQLRLERLPVDLEQYFKQILDTIEDVYQEQTAQIFQMTVYATSPLPAIAFSFVEKMNQDPDFALKAKMQLFPDTEVASISEKMRKHLNARCKDLIEINTNDKESVNFLQYRVDFLHRTVRDFLMTKDMYNLLQSRVPRKFDARVALCKVLLVMIKAIPLPDGEYTINSNTVPDSLVNEIIYYAREVETHNRLPEVALLDELDRVLLAHANSIPTHSKVARGLLWQYSSKKFMATVTKAGLQIYVAQKLNSQPQFLFQVFDRPLLRLAVESQSANQNRIVRGYDTEFSVDVDMVRELLNRRANPNEEIEIAPLTSTDRCTVWGVFLHNCFKNRAKDSYGLPEQLFETAEMFIRHGADPDLNCASHITGRYPTGDEEATPLTILKAVLRPFQYQQIAGLLVEKRAAKRGIQPLEIYGLEMKQRATKFPISTDDG